MAAVQAPESEDQTKLHGFTENRQAPLPELDATLHEMEHAQAGVRLVWLERDEANMTFGIACPTLPGDDTGAWQLAAKLLSLEYLWNAVRVQGGAYGTGLVVRDTGLAACYSYRDPRGKQSLQAYTRCAGFLRQFCREGRDLTGLIIGAVSDSEPLLSPQAQGTTADAWYWQGVDYAERCRRRQELLSATPDTLLALADALEGALQGGVCVVGGQPQLEACGLDHVESV